MVKLVYTDQSSYLTNNFNTVNVGTKVFDLSQKKWYRVSAPGEIKADTAEPEVETPPIE